MTARLLIDQCVIRRMAAAIFAPIADVAYVGDLAQGAPDTDVLALAVREQFQSATGENARIDESWWVL